MIALRHHFRGVAPHTVYYFMGGLWCRCSTWTQCVIPPSDQSFEALKILSFSVFVLHDSVNNFLNCLISHMIPDDSILGMKIHCLSELEALRNPPFYTPLARHNKPFYSLAYSHNSWLGYWKKGKVSLPLILLTAGVEVAEEWTNRDKPRWGR